MRWKARHLGMEYRVQEIREGGSNKAKTNSQVNINHRRFEKVQGWQEWRIKKKRLELNMYLTYLRPRAIMPYKTPHRNSKPDPNIVERLGHITIAGRAILRAGREDQ